MGREAGGRTAAVQLLVEVVEAVGGTPCPAGPGQGRGAFAASLSQSLWQPRGLLLQGGYRQG